MFPNVEAGGAVGRHDGGAFVFLDESAVPAAGRRQAVARQNGCVALADAGPKYTDRRPASKAALARTVCCTCPGVTER